MHPTIETIAVYLLRVAPALVFGAILIWMTRREPRIRIVLYMALFVLLRDAMTPLGLWRFGTQGFFWIRLSDDPLILLAFAASCAGMVLLIYSFDRANRPLLQWTRGNVPLGLLVGMAGTILVVLPLAIVYRFVPIESRGGPIPLAHLPAILCFALLGNLLEEAIFRGYVYGDLVRTRTPTQAGIASGFVFAFCHIYLATTVTSIGYPLLVFTLWEGIIAGLVASRHGVLASTATHGGAIFLLSSGLL
jgi:uncharacterized protein